MTIGLTQAVMQQLLDAQTAKIQLSISNQQSEVDQLKQKVDSLLKLKSEAGERVQTSTSKESTSDNC